MILVTIEHLPRGDKSKAKTLGTLEIVNDLSHPYPPDFGNYACKLTTKGDSCDFLRTITVKDHPRYLGWEKLARDAFGYFDIYHKDEEIKKLRARIAELEGNPISLEDEPRMCVMLNPYCKHCDDSFRCKEKEPQ